MQNSAGISSSSALRAREEDGQLDTEPSLHTTRTYEVFFSTGLRKASAKHRTNDLENLKNLSKRLLTLTDAEIEIALAESELIEVPDDKEDKS